MGKTLILASASPRRNELLKKLPWAFITLPADVDELSPGETGTEDLPVRNASLKAGAVAALKPGCYVLGVDTVIMLDGRIYGKPASLDEARSMLKNLSGREHQVISGVAIFHPDGTKDEFSISSRVKFAELSEKMIDDYLACAPVLDKAGAYAIQEHPEMLGAEVSGSIDNVIGLPTEELAQHLEKCDLTLDVSKIPYCRRLATLFFNYVKIAAFVLGGGYAIIPAADAEFCRNRRYISEDDVMDMLVITQSVPGILACSSSTFIGWKTAGWLGAAVAIVGAALPSVIIISLIAAGSRNVDLSAPWIRGAFTGAISGICALVFAMALKTGKKALKKVFDWLIFFGMIAGVFIFNIGPAVLLAAAVVVGMIYLAVMRFWLKKETLK